MIGSRLFAECPLCLMPSGDIEMNQIQTWFERIAGVCRVERSRYEFARAIFARPPFNEADFRMPACWRRKLRSEQTESC